MGSYRNGWFYQRRVRNKQEQKNPDRCLPLAKARSLSKAERAKTARKKKASGGKKQFVPNTKKAKVRTKK